MNVTRTIIRLLTFQLTRVEMLQLNRRHFIAGLIGTWIVGMGRYWDDGKANLLQHLGLGSVIYIFVLAAFIWLILLPFRIEKWDYSRVLIFISLTSFPAVFYAIPVERFFDLQTANSMNAWFLGLVAIWRLTLLYFFISTFTGLRAWAISVVTLMPICIIITVLTILNLHRVVYDFMSGIRTPSAHDSSYIILTLLTSISMLLAVPLLFLYAAAIYQHHRSGKSK